VDDKVRLRGGGGIPSILIGRVAVAGWQWCHSKEEIEGCRLVVKSVAMDGNWQRYGFFFEWMQTYFSTEWQWLGGSVWYRWNARIESCRLVVFLWRGSGYCGSVSCFYLFFLIKTPNFTFSNKIIL
jgi:hypothetical protein